MSSALRRPRSTRSASALSVRTATFALAAVVAVSALSGCASVDGAAEVSPVTSASPEAPAGPAPESTVAATSLDATAEIPADMRISVIALDAGNPSANADTEAALAALNTFAAEHDVTIALVPGVASASGTATTGTTGATGATGAIDVDATLAAALLDEPNVIIMLGESLLSALDRVSASNLGQQFLVIGAQLPEPTENVTAVVWPGADGRIIDDVAPVIAPRMTEALDAGLRVVAHSPGIVVTLP